MKADHRLNPGTRSRVFGVLAAIVFLLGPPVVLKQTGSDFLKFFAGWMCLVFVLGRTASVYARENRLAEKTLEEQGKPLEEQAGTTEDDKTGSDPSGAIRPYVLFARPFSAEGLVSAPADNLGKLSPAGYIDGESQTLEQFLVRALGDVRVLGGSRETIGPLRIQTENDWQETFRNLAVSANLIVVLPLDGAGTNWELGWLKEAGLLGRTLVIMPSSYSHAKHEAGERWEAARASLLPTGIQLPPYRPAGAYVRFAHGVLQAYPLKGYSIYALRDLVSRIRDYEQYFAPSRQLIFSLIIAGVMALDVWVFSKDRIGLLLLVLPITPIVLLATANKLFRTQFSVFWGWLAGVSWLMLVVFVFAGGTEWSGALSGGLAEGYRASSASAAFLIKYHQLVSPVIAASVVSLSFAQMTYTSVISASTSDVWAIVGVWSLATFVISLISLVQPFGSDFSYQKLAFVLGAFCGGLAWSVPLVTKKSEPILEGMSSPS